MRTLHMQWRKALGLAALVGAATLYGLWGAGAEPPRADTSRGTTQLFNAAERGDARAQGRIAFMYETGRGLPQDYYQAASWYLRAAEQGSSAAQYRLGLLFDKGLGVPEDYVQAYKWLNLAAAGTGAANREHFLRARDAIARKMTLTQLERAQWLASHWRPQ
jgi:TPR repeat protein